MALPGHIQHLSSSIHFVSSHLDKMKALLPHAHAQGGKAINSSVVVGTKIARSHVLGIIACCKHTRSVDIGEKLVCMCFKLLKKAY